MEVASVMAALEENAKLQLHWCALAWMLAGCLTKEMKRHMALEMTLRRGGLSLAGSVLEDQMRRWSKDLGDGEDRGEEGAAGDGEDRGEEGEADALQKRR